MTYEKALRIAIEALDKQIHAIAFDANAHDLLKLDTPHAINSSQKRKELREARDVLGQRGMWDTQRRGDV